MKTIKFIKFLFLALTFLFQFSYDENRIIPLTYNNQYKLISAEAKKKTHDIPRYLTHDIPFHWKQRTQFDGPKNKVAKRK